VVEVFFKGYGQWAFINDFEEPSFKNPSDMPPLDHLVECRGVFVLPHNEEITYIHLGSLEGIHTLLPSLTHLDSHLIRQMLSVDGNTPDEFYFRIDISRPMDIKVIDDVEMIDTSKNAPSCLLAILNDASRRFWGNADPDEKDTHTKNAIVIDWLINKGFSEISARQGATIIRPEWAAKGNY
jgi:hypothetical protein